MEWGQVEWGRVEWGQSRTEWSGVSGAGGALRRFVDVECGDGLHLGPLSDTVGLRYSKSCKHRFEVTNDTVRHSPFQLSNLNTA